MDLTITGFTAAALAILLALLALDTIRHRFRTRLSFGLGEDAGLTSASRAHGNLAENAPITLILIGLLEVGGADRQILTYAAGTFVAARVLHAIGLYTPSKGPPPLPRAIGVIATLVVQLGLAGWLVSRLV
ncbi:MAPEG family protein [Sphingomonas sp. AOB5]|uniref:MAPEG family protein n=1 Tax=Sphingomonas sp. AOB5 TaxID=3034017 RepID=UPI0023F8766F|nr:MAPEG family protein [Sphingomonas sp. AOB5]MDF7777020.1 MAPEG family protein [Sphingomonas sp. AOB5]